MKGDEIAILIELGLGIGSGRVSAGVLPLDPLHQVGDILGRPGDLDHVLNERSHATPSVD